MYTVYILLCEDGSVYTGITNDLEKRFTAHVAGRGGRYTRSHPVTKIVYTEQRRTKGAALTREAHIKGMTKAGKSKLIAEWKASTKRRLLNT